jgi:hypothetical protein
MKPVLSHGLVRQDGSREVVRDGIKNLRAGLEQNPFAAINIFRLSPSRRFGLPYLSSLPTAVAY